MNWFEPVRAYCERTDAGFWSEPANALSNAAFLLAAAAVARRASQARPPDRSGLALAALIGVIGIGSFLFHTLAVRWAMLADVIRSRCSSTRISRWRSVGFCASPGRASLRGRRVSRCSAFPSRPCSTT